jgi:hypothetical protein
MRRIFSRLRERRSLSPQQLWPDFIQKYFNLESPDRAICHVMMNTTSGDEAITAARECIQHSLPHAANTERRKSREPDHCRITIASPQPAHTWQRRHILCAVARSESQTAESSSDASTSTGFFFPQGLHLPTGIGVAAER